MVDLPPLYPLRFDPIYKEKVWGGRRLEALGRDLPDDSAVRIGESWELADLGRTAASGGGGGAERSCVAEGPLLGRTLHELMRTYGWALMGDLKPNRFGEFPLLVKFLDAQENLSVQVHPSAAYAAAHDDAFLKSEAWYVVDCEPGAAIYKGIKEGVTPAQLRQAIENNDRGQVESLLIRVEVEPGDCHYLPSGTCHALGAGVVVAEVQTPSDTTFRVYDWGRTGRELHIEQAMQCLDFGPPDVTPYEKHTFVAGDLADVTHLVVSEYFRIDRYYVKTSGQQELGIHQPTLWMVLEGGGVFGCGQTGEGAGDPAGGDGPSEVRFGRGQTLLLSPGMACDHMRVDGGTTFLEVSFPQARSTQIARGTCV